MRPNPRLSAMRLALISLLSTLALLTGCSSDEGFYGGCDGSDECVPEAECVVVAFEAGRDGAMCTADCTVNADCPGNSACYELLGDPIEGQRVCYQRCEFDSDCSPNFTCAEAAMGPAVIDFICLPL